jgi:hypothetical protein
MVDIGCCFLMQILTIYISDSDIAAVSPSGAPEFTLGF